MFLGKIHKSWGMSIVKIIYSATLMIFSQLSSSHNLDAIFLVWMIHFLNLLICILDSHILVDCFNRIFIFLLHCKKLRALKLSCGKNFRAWENANAGVQLKCNLVDCHWPAGKMRGCDWSTQNADMPNPWISCVHYGGGLGAVLKKWFNEIPSNGPQ